MQKQFVSYFTLRLIIGILGLSLPIILPIGCLLLSDCTQLQPSISHYYYTVMNGYFTATLYILGIFLLIYKGYEPIDNKISNIAGISALLVAMFPTDPNLNSTCQFITRDGMSVNAIHLLSAVILFLCFAFFSLKLFTKSENSIVEPNSQKDKRNKIYRVCGYTIITCLSLMVISVILNRVFNISLGTNIVFILESIALIAFGTSWLTKSNSLEILYKD